jgi:hypothetical protein
MYKNLRRSEFQLLTWVADCESRGWPAFVKSSEDPVHRLINRGLLVDKLGLYGGGPLEVSPEGRRAYLAYPSSWAEGPQNWHPGRSDA